MSILKKKKLHKTILIEMILLNATGNEPNQNKLSRTLGDVPH